MAVHRRNDSLKTLQRKLAAFAAERDWDQFHNPKNLAMALVGEAGEPGRMAAWTSKDGLRWLPSVLDPAPSDDALRHVIWDGDRFLAFGRPGLDEEVWLSADGTHWRRTSSVPDVALEGAEDGCTGSAICPRSWVAGAVADRGAVVAFGATSSGLLGEAGLVWTSPRLLTGP